MYTRKLSRDWWVQYSLFSSYTKHQVLSSVQKNIILLETSNVVIFGGNNIKFGEISQSNSTTTDIYCSVELLGFCMIEHCTALALSVGIFDATLQLVYMTGLSDAVSANVGDTEKCTGSALECNPNVIYAIIAPLAAVTTLAIVGACIFVSMEAKLKLSRKHFDLLYIVQPANVTAISL